MCGGDGSLITLLMKLQEAGVDINEFPSVVLPYGTGNDFARETGWGGDPGQKYLSSLKKTITEICLHSIPVQFNVWDIDVTFNERGEVYVIDSKTKQYTPKRESFFHRYMLNYFGMGEDARIAMGILFSKCV